MSDKPYSPMNAIRRATRSMNKTIAKHTPPSERPLTLAANDQPVPCAVLLASFTEGGPVPSDFIALPKTSAALKAHVRPDGAVYKGAFELQGHFGSVVLAYGPKDMTMTRAEQVATIERTVLLKRHEAHALGIFAASPISKGDTSNG